jgi:Leucine-rich repeat (LRR) protein
MIDDAVQNLSDDAKQSQTIIELDHINNGYSLFSPELKCQAHYFADFIAIVQNIDLRDFDIVESVRFVGLENERTTHYAEILKFMMSMFPNVNTLYWDSTEIPDGMFNIEECQQITELVLGSDMTEYPETLLCEFKNITELTIHRSSMLTSLPCGFFNYTPHLVDVSISYTSIEKFPDEFFSSLTELKYLGLIGNKLLTQLPSMLLNTKLTNVGLTECESITHINNVFPPSIQLLNLSYCKSLTTFGDNFFKHLPNLYELDVCHTGLKTLPDSIVYATCLSTYIPYIEPSSIDNVVPELVDEKVFNYYIKNYVNYYNAKHYIGEE